MRFALLLLVACDIKVTTPTNVDVSCETKKEGLECSLRHVAGSTETEACWDISFTCTNGAIFRPPHLCAKVNVGGTAKVVVPLEKLEGIEKCRGDKPPIGKLESLTIDGKTPSSLTPHD